MSKLKDENARALAENLFVPTERWGWQYVPPDAARPSPDLQREPRWGEPPPPDFRGLTGRQAWQRKQAVHRGLIVGGICFVGLVLVGLSLGRFGLPLVLLAMTFAAMWFLPMLRTNHSVSAIQRQYEWQRQQEWIRFNQAHDRWRDAVVAWDRSELARRDATDLWYPLELRSSPQRVDVFGGTPDGWSALLCTVGTTLIEAGTPVFVIDFTEEDVTGPLCEVAHLKGFPVSRQNVPANLEAARLLDGMGVEAVAEVVAESVDTMRRGGEDVELRMLDVELVQAVVTRLDDDVTFRRIAAGLLALQQGYDPDRDRRLSAREFQRITEVVDTVAATERVRNEIQFLRGVLDMLPAPAPGEEIPPPEVRMPRGMWPEAGVSVLRTEDDNRRRRDFVDRLMAQVLLHNVRRARNRDAGFVLALAGADHLGHQTLELLARRCRQAGIRLVLMMEHLRGDLQQLLGGSDSVTFFMRLGNAQEAALAAEHIGRGHSFLLTQLTRQSGQTDTTGTSRTTGTSSSYTTGSSDSRARTSRDWFDAPTITRTLTSNTSVTTGESSQFGTNESRAISTTDGETVSRVYEFTVEPTKIQSLDRTSFLFVESVDGERRVVAGNCDPYVVLMPRVSGSRPASPGAAELAAGAGAASAAVGGDAPGGRQAVDAGEGRVPADAYIQPTRAPERQDRPPAR